MNESRMLKTRNRILNSGDLSNKRKTFNSVGGACVKAKVNVADQCTLRTEYCLTLKVEVIG